jgi:hypothetical protein
MRRPAHGKPEWSGQSGFGLGSNSHYTVGRPPLAGRHETIAAGGYDHRVLLIGAEP